MIEAMACGTPVIAYPLGSVPEVMTDGVTGFMVRDLDEAIVAVGRASLLSRQRIREVFDRRFTSRRMAEDYLELYERVRAPFVSRPGVSAA
jgi:glycosyltransferase involved in cell wall biosynthesis